MFVYFFLHSFFWFTRKYLHNIRTIFTSTLCHPFVWIFILFLHCLYGVSATANTTCSNASAFFNCTDGLYCIPIAHRCNFAINCHDESDEINCNSVCTTGYRWSGVDCVDIDECQEFLACSQICTNTPGSFSCSCVQGYDLYPVSGTFCKASGPLPYILVSASDIIFSLYPDSDSDTITYFTQFSKCYYLSPLQDVTAIGFHFKKGLVFWSDLSKHSFYVDSLSQTPSDASPYLMLSPVIHDMYMRPASLAVDWMSDKLYWTDDLNGKIEVSGLDGTNRRVLISGLIKPKSLAIDAEWGYLFFTICDPNEPKILRSNLDGSNMIVLHNSTLITPNALTVDLPTHTLYWLDAGLGRIERSDVSGLNRHVVISDRNQIHNPTSMSIYEDTIYFTDSYIHGVVAVHKDGSRNRQIARRINEASSLQVVYPSAQPDFTNSNPCLVDNGGCSHLCLLSNSSSHSCLCPTLLSHSYNPQLGTNTCVYPNQFILVITGMSMRVISLLAPNYVDAQLDIARANISRVVWDDSTTTLFWISGFDGCIYRYQLGARESQILLQDKLIRITDIAYDWVHSLLFFIDETNKRVEVVSVDSPDRRSVVMSHGLIRPRSIVVDPLHGYIAWLDVMSSPDVRPVIMTAAMDGSNRRVLVSHRLLDPTILTADYRSSYLYWFDKGSGSVERVHLDGTLRGTIMSTRYIVSAFSIYRGDVFWSPEEVERIFRYNPSSRSNTTIMTGLHSISHLSIYHQRKLTADFNTSCSTSQTNCSQFCLYHGSHTNRTNSVCMCYNGYELTDSSHCGLNEDLYAVLLQDNDLYYSTVRNYSLHTLIRIRTQNITSLALDPTDSDVVFIGEKSVRGGTIRKVVFDKVSHSIGNTTILYSHLLGSVSDIAIEPRTRLLYWLDSQNGVIGVGSVAGDKRTIVLGQDLINPQFILLNVNTSSLYWVELRSAGSFINRISLDGSNKQRIKTLLGEQITSFALATIIVDDDYVQYLLWTVLSSPNIYCYEIELDFIYFIPTSSSSPYSLSIHQSEVYWSSRDTNAIYTATLTPGNPPSLTGTRTIFSSELPLSAVEIQSYRDRFYSPSPCTQYTACNYLCLPSSQPQGYSCHCPPGIVSQVDSYCPRLPSRFLLISLHSEIHYVSLDTSYTVPALLYHESGLITGAAVVYAPSETYSTLIWSDISTRNRWAIKKMDIDTQAVSVLVRGVFARGLAVDQVAGQLYFTDRFNHSIMVYDLETDAVKSIVRNETNQQMLKPRSLAIDTIRKYLFWSDWGLGTIERSRLDGTERKIIVSHSILEPSGLAIDLVRDRLYWVDYAFKTIESCDYEGMNRFTVAQNLSQPYSLTLSYPDLYFTDWTNNTLNCISLLHPASSYNTTYQSTAIIMDVRFVSVNFNPPRSTDKTAAATSSASSATTTTQSHNSTISYLYEYPHKYLFTVLYILAVLLVLLISALFIVLAYMYCNLRRLKRRQTFSPHSMLRNSPPSPQNIAIADAIFSLTNATSTPQQQTSTQSDNILTKSNQSESSHIPLKPILTPEHSTTLEEAVDTASPRPTSSTTQSNSVVSAQDYTPKRSFARGKVCYKLLSKFQEQPEESCLTTPFTYNSLSPSKKNSSQYNSSCF